MHAGACRHGTRQETAWSFGAVARARVQNPPLSAKKSVHASVRIFYFFTLHSSLFTKSACTDFLEGNK